MTKKYPKNHPLWPVYDFQKQTIERGGKINWYTDLLAFFERRSLKPEQEPISIFIHLIEFNKSVIKNKTGLYEINKIFYEKRTYGWIIVKDFSKYNKDLSEHKTHLEDEEFIKALTFLNDNEFIMRGTKDDVIVKLPDKYVDILRLIKNGYNPDKIIMKTNNNLLPAIILAAGLIIAAFIYAYSTRYVIEKNIIKDKWTGTMKMLEFKE